MSDPKDKPQLPILSFPVTGLPFEKAPLELQELQMGFDGAVRLRDGSWSIQRDHKVIARIMILKTEP